MNTTSMRRLTGMLSLCRPHGSEGEKLFIKKFLMPYAPTILKDDAQEVLALVVEVGDSEGLVPPIMFSGHTDTVHYSGAASTQKLVIDAGLGMIYKDDGAPLGADNAAGCWLMLEMIDAKVPGVYVFHRGEERGGIGSKGVENCHKDWLARFQWAIAFDRRGTGDIITEMFCGRTCSDEFAQSLADRLSERVKGLTQLSYMPDDTGSFTDTANYVKIIPECTNVSVGYDNEHSGQETLDLIHLQALRDVMVAQFRNGPGDLPVVRDPSVEDVGSRWGWAEFELGSGRGPVDAEDVVGMHFREVAEWVKKSHPEDVADLLVYLAEKVVYRDEGELSWNGGSLQEQ